MENQFFSKMCHWVDQPYVMHSISCQHKTKLIHSLLCFLGGGCFVLVSFVLVGLCFDFHFHFLGRREGENAHEVGWRSGDNWEELGD